MKRIILIITLLIAVFLAFHFSYTPTEFLRHPLGSTIIKINSNEENEFLNIEVRRVSDSRVQIIYTNLSEESLMYGYLFQLEVYRNGQWTMINEDMMFHDRSFGLEPQRQTILSVDVPEERPLRVVREFSLRHMRTEEGVLESQTVLETITELPN